MTLSVVGTSDLHGAAQTRNGIGGLALFAGYVDNLRNARAADGGAVLLIDSGDTYQGDIESNLSEGALVVDAYNAIGYTARAIGNHDFDFGAVDSADARQSAGDSRGALKARAVQAHHPFLAANLIDEATGRPVDWPNVHPSVLVERVGVKIGVIGVITADALRSTLAVNVQGLRVAPLAPAIVTEASALRAAGAEVVIVAAHAGGRCERFDDPDDLSSCDQDSEIFRVARSLPAGLVDVIAAGHTHAGIAHRVNGVAIIQPFWRGQAFGRVDVVVDRRTRRVEQVRIDAPHSVCAETDPAGTCVPATGKGVRAQYEGRPVVADPAVARAMGPALERVQRLLATRLGVSLEAAIRRGGEEDSPLGDVFAEAIRDAVPGADVGIVNNATRGLWADLPEGPLTFGRLYTVFPFDNRIARITLTAADLERWLAGEIRQGREGALGVSGVSVRASCAADGLHLALVRDGRPIDDRDRLTVVTIGGPTLSGNVATSDPLGGGPTDNGPVVREAVEDWLRQPGHVSAQHASRPVRQRMNIPAAAARGCAI